MGKRHLSHGVTAALGSLTYVSKHSNKFDHSYDINYLLFKILFDGIYIEESNILNSCFKIIYIYEPRHNLCLSSNTTGKRFVNTGVLEV